MGSKKSYERFGLAEHCQKNSPVGNENLGLNQTSNSIVIFFNVLVSKDIQRVVPLLRRKVSKTYWANMERKNCKVKHGFPMHLTKYVQNITTNRKRSKS